MRGSLPDRTRPDIPKLHEAPQRPVHVMMPSALRSSSLADSMALPHQRIDFMRDGRHGDQMFTPLPRTPSNGTLRSAGRLPNCCSWSENQPVAYHGNSLGLPRLGVSSEPPLAPFPAGDLGRVLTEHHPVETFCTCQKPRPRLRSPYFFSLQGSIPRPRAGGGFFISGDRPTMAPCPPSLRPSSIPTTARSVPASARLRLPSPRGLSARKPLGQRRQPSMRL